MAQRVQQNQEQKGPFSPLQSGCAFVMLANMLIYLAVVVFVFNLLDPSELNLSYIAKRGFTAKPTEEREEDKAFRQMSEQKSKEQKKGVDFSAPEPEQEAAPATKLSVAKPRELASSRPEEPSKPKSSLTQGSTGGGGVAARTTQRSSIRTGNISIRTAQPRLYSVAMYPQATLPQPYSPIGILIPRPLVPELYETLPVQLAPGLEIPMFGMPTIDNAGAYLYFPRNPVSDPIRGERKINSPPVGSESLYTNKVDKIETPRPAKDTL
jgi:hypothetical protein